MAEAFLQIRHLSASFRGYQGDLSALDDVSFDVARGEFVCLIGPSGCGKSTLLRIAAGLLQPTRGEVLLEGKPHSTPHKRVGLVFQQPALLPWRTVADNIALPLEMEGLPARDIRARTDALLAQVGLSGFEAEYPIHLSGGMAQRTAMARALAQNPEVLLLDEPFGALDALTRERMAVELLRLWERDKRTVLMVTHSVEEAALLSDRVIVLSARPGRVVDNVNVTLPRPRSAALLVTPELQQIAGRLRASLSQGDEAGR
ncbi:MAG TPA: ABC transporter ATP-binding protein [Anaerolineae bacterium]|nr:ABC transporter ATP-binding protein [Anaerolineae bacterium]HQH38171.1 ABC transporter ATP-binding protein [Anaerolineae bacterium]